MRRRRRCPLLTTQVECIFPTKGRNHRVLLSDYCCFPWAIIYIRAWIFERPLRWISRLSPFRGRPMRARRSPRLLCDVALSNAQIRDRNSTMTAWPRLPRIPLYVPLLKETPFQPNILSFRTEPYTVEGESRVARLFFVRASSSWEEEGTSSSSSLAQFRSQSSSFLRISRGYSWLIITLKYIKRA